MDAAGNITPADNVANRMALTPQTLESTAFGRGASNEARRLVVIHRAAELFEARGFHGTSMQDVAEAVGITKAALYHYVDSKQELLFEIHDAFISTMLSTARQFVADNADPRAQMRFFVRNIFETVANYRPYVRAFFQDFGILTGEWHDKIRAKRDEYEALVDACLHNGRRLGVFEFSGPDRLGAMFLFGACNWSYQWLRTDGELGVDAIAEMWEDLLLHGFSR